MTCFLCGIFTSLPCHRPVSHLQFGHNLRFFVHNRPVLSLSFCLFVALKHSFSLCRPDWPQTPWPPASRVLGLSVVHHARSHRPLIQNISEVSLELLIPPPLPPSTEMTDLHLCLVYAPSGIHTRAFECCVSKPSTNRVTSQIPQWLCFKTTISNPQKWVSLTHL